MSESIGVCRLADLVDGQPKLVSVDGRAMLVVKQQDRVYTVADTCSHAEVSLADAEVGDGYIECWLHGSRFDLTTGEPSGPPAFEPIETYSTDVRNGADGEPTVVVNF